MLPEGFSYIDDQRFILDIKYATNDNFLGRIVNGYEKPVGIISTKTMAALIAVQNTLTNLDHKYRLKIFDAYRPQCAVDDFIKWATEIDESHKTKYYPDLTKSQLFELGYIAKHSEHTRGSAVDLTVCIDNQELDMGSIFDFFGEPSNTDYPFISPQHKSNRQFLHHLMQQHGFINFEKEWWHYRLKEEAFPNTYFNFPII